LKDSLLLHRRYLLSQARLYAILDLSYLAETEVERVASQLVAGGVDLIQLRAKNHSASQVTALARRIQPLLQGTEILFIINDHPAVAAEVGADGVHVGQDDLTVAEVRTILAPDQLVGLSTHSLPQALRAQEQQPDYIGVGPIYATPTKPDYVPVGLSLIREVKAAVHLPQFCIGGIKLENLREVIEAGAGRVVIVSGLLQAPDITAYAREVKQIIGAQGLWA
jgi:thiamine-phosphate pyrophosphorylase